ncbi:MAG: hypothetical protein KJZ78_25645, partial [Bryobacteraceae bacterium]|nr:hypothetical protein [Bryobacteraceae bacterium]
MHHKNNASMPDERVELLFEFVTQGVAEIDKAAASVDKVIAGSDQVSPSLKNMERGLGDAARAAQSSGRSFIGLGDQVRNRLSAPLQNATTAVESLLSRLW